MLFLLPFYIYAYYDVEKIYSPKLGFKVRKKIFENYFPNKIYGEENEKISKEILFLKSAREVKDFIKTFF